MSNNKLSNIQLEGILLAGRSTKHFKEVQQLTQNEKIDFILDILNDNGASFMKYIKEKKLVKIAVPVMLFARLLHNHKISKPIKCLLIRD